MDNDERASTRPREKHSKRQKQKSQSYLPSEKHYYKLIGTYLLGIFLPTHLLTYLPTQLVRIYLPPYFYLHAYLPTHFLLTYLMGIFYLPTYSTLIIIIIIILYYIYIIIYFILFKKKFASYFLDEVLNVGCQHSIKLFFYQVIFKI
jgi:hypothetical protein